MNFMKEKKREVPLERKKGWIRVPCSMAGVVEVSMVSSSVLTGRRQQGQTGADCPFLKGRLNPKAAAALCMCALSTSAGFLYIFCSRSL